MVLFCYLQLCVSTTQVVWLTVEISKCRIHAVVSAFQLGVPYSWKLHAFYLLLIKVEQLSVCLFSLKGTYIIAASLHLLYIFFFDP